jgi:hypothetical protein
VRHKTESLEEIDHPSSRYPVYGACYGGRHVEDLMTREVETVVVVGSAVAVAAAVAAD